MRIELQLCDELIDRIQREKGLVFKLLMTSKYYLGIDSSEEMEIKASSMEYMYHDNIVSLELPREPKHDINEYDLFLSPIDYYGAKLNFVYPEDKKEN